MVLFVLRFAVAKGMESAYAEWAPTALRRALDGPGVVELRAWRTAVGPTCGAVIETIEFADLAAWTAWVETPFIAQTLEELRTYAEDVTAEIWTGSPLIPRAVYPARPADEPRG